MVRGATTSLVIDIGIVLEGEGRGGGMWGVARDGGRGAGSEFLDRGWHGSDVP